MISNVHLLKERNDLLETNKMLVKKIKQTFWFLEIENNNLAILTNDDLEKINIVLLNFDNKIQLKTNKRIKNLIDELDDKQDRMTSSIVKYRYALHDMYFDIYDIDDYNDDKEDDIAAHYSQVILKRSKEFIDIVINYHKMSQEISMSINNNNQIINDYLKNSMDQYILQYLSLPVLLYTMPISQLFIFVQHFNYKNKGTFDYNDIHFDINKINDIFTFDDKFNNILNYINTPLMKIKNHIENMEKRYDKSNISNDESGYSSNIYYEPIAYCKKLINILDDSELRPDQLSYILMQLIFKITLKIESSTREQDKLIIINNKKKILRNIHTSG